MKLLEAKEKHKFTLSETFLEKYKHIKPAFGYEGLGEVVYKRTYARLLEDGSKEEWWQTVRRVVEGCYTIQKIHINKYLLGWHEQKAQKSAEEMYELMFTLKFTPPGRGLTS